MCNYNVIMLGAGAFSTKHLFESVWWMRVWLGSILLCNNWLKEEEGGERADR